MQSANKNIKELTFLSILLGLVIGIIMTAANVYLGLYAGMTVSASIPAAVIGLGVYKGVFGRNNIYETNIIQTMASAGESLAAGIIFTLPALVIVGAWSNFNFWQTTLIAMTGGILGVVFMIPLRKALIEDEEELIYPEGVACASVLQSSEQDNNPESTQQAKRGMKIIFSGFLLGGLLKTLSSGLKIATGSLEVAGKLGGKVFFMGADLSLALVAVGYIVRMRVALLVLIGGLIGWVFVLPFLAVSTEQESLSALDLAWTLWSSQIRYLGVGAMIVGGVASIFSVRKGIIQGFSNIMQDKEALQSQTQDFPRFGLLILLSLSFLVMVGIYHQLLSSLTLSISTTLLMMLISFLFVAVSSYIVGLVGSSNNPVSGMTISALLITAVFFLALGMKGESAILATLGVAAIVCCAACTAGDCSQDLKTGQIIGASPKSQQIAQVIGVLIPAFVIAPTLSVLHSAHTIGVGLKAPQATLFASITKGIFMDTGLPYDMIFYGAIIGLVILAINGTMLKNSTFKLHLMPVAVGIYLPITLAVPMVLGAFLHIYLKKKDQIKDESDDLGILTASGLIAGEAVLGVLLALLVYLKVDISVASIPSHYKDPLSIVIFALLILAVVKISRKKKAA